MEYGFIVIKNNDYSTLFFIHNIDDKEITMIANSEPSQKITDDISNKDNYTIVYKPKLRGVCELNNLYLNTTVLLTYKDTEREGKIIKKKKDMINIYFFKEPNKPTEVFNFDYKGIPSNISKIEKIQNKDVNTKEYKQTFNANETINSTNISTENTYYYSIEQQVQQILEDITKNVDLKDNKKNKEINKIINRYIEMNRKYYTYSNNYIFKPLSNKPIYNTIINGNSIFEFYSTNIKIKLYDDPNFIPNDMSKQLIAKLFGETYSINEEFLQRVSSFQLSPNGLSIETGGNTTDDKNIDQLIIEESHNKSKYNMDNYTNVLLEDIKGEVGINKYDSDLYSIKTSKSFLIDGIVIPSLKRLNEYMNGSRMNTIINKINLHNYTEDYYVIGDINENPCIFKEDNQIIKKNKEINGVIEKKEFYTFLNRTLPNIRYLLKCLNIKCYNIYDYIKKISVFNIYELSKIDYDYISRLIKKNIINYKKTKPTIKNRPTYMNSSIFMDTIFKETISNKNASNSETSYFKENYYSNSELFQLSLNINHTLIFFDLIKSNIDNKLDIKTGSIEQIINELKTENNRDITVTYDKLYNSVEELRMDTKPIFKDITLQDGPIINPADTYKKSSDLIWKNIDIRKYTSFESFEKELKEYVISYNNPYLDEYKDMIQRWSIKYMITNGMFAYVIDIKKTYIYENDNWTIYKEGEFVKGSSELNSFFNKRINEIVKDESSKKLYLKQKYADRDYYIMKSRYLNLFNKSVFYKYNQTKRVYSQLYVSNGYKESPYQLLFDKILNIDNQSDKYKSIKIFCELYTVEGEDPYWLYCIESGNKLVPKFIKTIAYSNNYNETIQKICYEQGKQQDEYWVDKYSGYTIIKINFIEDEGFTSDGFKMVSREVIKEDDKTNSINERNIETVLNSIGISLEYTKAINTEYKKIIKSLTPSLLLLYGVIFIYIQCYVNTSEITESFFSCKTSFEGYPLSKEKTTGIEYMLCIYKSLTNEKKDIPNENFIIILKNILKYNSKLNYQLTQVKKDKHNKEFKIMNSWDLFLPRMNEIKMPKIDNAYYRSFYFQKNMNDYIQKIEPFVKLTNGRYKIINNYLIEQSINEILVNYVNTDLYKQANLYYFSHNTKDPNKYNIPKLTYSLEKINLILGSEHTEITDELLKEARTKLHKNKKMNIVKPKVSESITIPITPEDILKYQSITLEFLRDKEKMNIKTLFQKLEYKPKTRSNIISGEYENDKRAQTILFNLLNDIILISKFKYKSEFEEPKLRVYLESILKKSDAIKLLTIIKTTYLTYKFPDIDETICEIMKLKLPFELKDQIAIYKYYLCTIYENIDVANRKILETMISIIIKNLTTKLDIIKKNNEQAKYKEKKEITDMFKELGEDSRNVEYMLKQNKLGKWSVGLSKSIYIYDGKADSEPLKEEEKEEKEEIAENDPENGYDMNYNNDNNED